MRDLHGIIKLSNANAYVEGQVGRKDIYLKDGRILKITEAGENEMSADQEIPCQGKLLLPGSIDTHVHIREPGSEARETFETGTMAAAAGGVTTVCEHPISVPPPSNSELLENRRRLAKPQAYVDICFFGALGSESIQEAEDLKRHGVVAYKTFLQEAMPGREKEFQGMTIADDYHLLRALQEAARLDMPIAFHAENNDIIIHTIEEMKQKGYVEPKAHYDSRPVISETECISRLLLFAEETGARILICHITSPEAMEMVKQAKAKGVRVTAETCPHYLFSCEEEAIALGAFARCNPPIRKREQVERLWGYLEDGTIDIIGSDHGPYTLEEKERGKTNIFLAPSGFSGLETRVPLMLDAVLRGRITLRRMVELTAENPAKVFRLDNRKGFIREGLDGDFILIDPEKETVIDCTKMYTKGRETARLFDGRKVKGQIEMTIVRGMVVAQNGIVDTKRKGCGELLFGSGQ